MAATLWATDAARRRIAAAGASVLMVGSYDGSANYGDVLQFAAMLDVVRELPGAPLPMAVVEREMLPQHAGLLERYPAALSGPAYVHFQAAGEDLPDDGLELLPAGLAASRSVVYLYGGGYLNRWWGERKAGLVDAARALAGRRRIPLVASGLQVEEAAAMPGAVGHDLLSGASWVGLRGVRSLEHVRDHLERPPPEKLALTGDDAIPAIRPAPAPAALVLNLHLNDHQWVSDDPNATEAGLVALLRALAERSGMRLNLRPTIAYDDARISERPAIAAFLDRHEAVLRASGLNPVEPLDVLADAFGNRLARFARARLTVCCSYHVALTSLLAGIPTVLLAENGYYEQKAAELRDLFELDEGMVGVPGGAEDAARAAEALVDGPARDSLVAHLKDASRRVVARQRRGREAVAAELAEALRPGPLGRLLSAIPRRGRSRRGCAAGSPGRR